jgi:hypothetical protein
MPVRLLTAKNSRLLTFPRVKHLRLPLVYRVVYFRLPFTRLIE